MTAEQIYGILGADYSGALTRLQRPALLERLLRLFTADPSMSQLDGAIKAGNAADAFRAVHTLKGVALNLGLTKLAESSITLTEILRGGTFADGYETAYTNLRAEYSRTIDAIGGLDN